MGEKLGGGAGEGRVLSTKFTICFTTGLPTKQPEGQQRQLEIWLQQQNYGLKSTHI